LEISVSQEKLENNMNRKISVLIVILVVMLFIATSVAILSTLERYAANQLLNKLSLAKLGVHISEIKQELGRQMREESELEQVILWGSVKDNSFLIRNYIGFMHLLLHAEYWKYIRIPMTVSYM
jgi:predicted PurR-regulated permease PerM